MLSRYKLMVARNLEPPTEWVRCINDVLVPVGTWHDGITRIAEFERRHPEYAAWLEPRCEA